MFFRLFSRAPTTVRRGPSVARRSRRYVDPSALGQVVSGQRLRVVGQLDRRTACDDLAAVPPRPRTEIDDPVGAADGLLVVFDDDDRVADIPERGERPQELGVVVLVQSDRRLVENVEHSDETRADLRRETDALRLTAREGPGGTIERQVVEPDVGEEPEPLTDLLEDLMRDLLVARAELEPAEECHALLDRHRRDIADGDVADPDGKRLGSQPRAVAGLAVIDGHEPFDPAADVLRLGLTVPTLEVRDGALETPDVLPSTLLELDVVLDLLVAGAAEEHLPHVRVEFLERGREIEAVELAERIELVPQPAGRQIGPARHRAFPEGLRVVGNDEIRIDPHLGSETAALRARSVGTVEREETRRELPETNSAVRARRGLGEEELLLADEDLDDPVAEFERRLERVDQPLSDLLREGRDGRR